MSMTGDSADNSVAVQSLLDGVSIEEVDKRLEELFLTISRVRSEGISVAFDAPTPEWSKSERQGPTINCYMYDLRQDLVRKQWGQVETLEDGIVVARHQQPRWFRLSYFLTVWSGDPFQEHDLLTQLLSALLAQDSLAVGPPPEADVEDERLRLPIALGMPPPQDRVLSELWSSLGSELRPSLDLIVSLPVMPASKDETGLPTLEPPRVRFGPAELEEETPASTSANSDSGSDGWRTRVRRPEPDHVGTERFTHVPEEDDYIERHAAAQREHERKARQQKDEEDRTS